jgi:WD40 repeat protein
MQIVTSGADRTARVWDGHIGKLLATIQGHQYKVEDASFSLDGTRIITPSWIEDRHTGSRTGTVGLWDASTYQQMAVLQGAMAAFSADSARILTSTAQLWDGHTGKLLADLKGDSVTFSPDGTRVFADFKTNTIGLWDARSGKLLKELEGWSPAFSPDSTHIFTEGGFGYGRLWDVHGKLIAILQGNSPAFSPDGRSLITASKNMAELWDVHTGQHLATLQGHSSNIVSAAFSPNGLRVVTQSEDGTVKIFLATAEGYFSIGCNLLRYQPESREVRQYCQPYVNPSK